MKSSDEMVNSLMERRDAYEAEQKRKRRAIARIATPVGCLCLTLLLGLGLWRGGAFKTKTPEPPTDSGILAAGAESSSNDTRCGEYWVIDNAGNGQKDVGEGVTEAEFNGSEAQSAEPAQVTEIGTLIVGGTTYRQSGKDADAYTMDECIGAVDEFDGDWKQYGAVSGKVFTAKEDPDVLIVILTGDVELVMVKD